MKPWPYQLELGEQAYNILKQYMIVYLAMEERTGKTITAIVAAELSNVTDVLVITKKKALDDWVQTLDTLKKAGEIKKNYIVSTYHSAHKVDANFQLCILDEAHSYISAYPKCGVIWKQIKSLVKKSIPIIYLSATPYPQGPQQLFHQFALSSWSPWLKYKNFYKWFLVYGKPYIIEINSINVPQYDRAHTDKIINDVKHLFITKTRKELGFEIEPEDKLHYIELDEETKSVYNDIIKHEIVELRVGLLVCDTKSKLRFSLHQIEGGTIKIEDEYFLLSNDEKIRYILKHFGDSKDLVIMYNYKAEKTKLEKVFKNALILQATSYAEGVDLHKYKNLVIYSQDFSTGRHTQRRARQANKNRTTPIVVHFLLVEKAISSQVYKTVSVNKKNFVDSVFKKEKL